MYFIYMPYLKIEFIPQFTMEPLLKKATHRYEEYVLRDIITLDLKRSWKRCDVNMHYNIRHQTYWMIKGSMKDLISPWSNSIIKMFTRGIIHTDNTKYVDAIPIFKLEINKIIALTYNKDMKRSIDGEVWDLTDKIIIKIIRERSIITNLHKDLKIEKSIYPF